MMIDNPSVFDGFPIGTQLEEALHSASDLEWGTPAMKISEHTRYLDQWNLCSAYAGPGRTSSRRYVFRIPVCNSAG